ncbi:hypothetical protein AQI70_08110 [Streptomyces curacoi]|uniref:Uncharacterized protein n=1 Tax=Streptomyces curacoi TaxID=146536 RepID=A0A124H679_9ACTN|nr:hypothetical protein AQI70_08110 [Streptomyces curacoi]
MADLRGPEEQHGYLPGAHAAVRLPATPQVRLFREASPTRRRSTSTVIPDPASAGMTRRPVGMRSALRVIPASLRASSHHSA